MEATYVFINRWMDKKDLVYIHKGILLCSKKIKILPLAGAQIDLEGIMWSEISQIEKDKYCVISFICGI